MAKKLVLLDTNGLVYRAFFALPYFTTTDGRPTNAVYGFANMLLKVLEEAHLPALARVRAHASASTGGSVNCPAVTARTA